MTGIRDNKGRFIQGASGNPAGRPQGIPNEGKLKIAEFIRDVAPAAMEHFKRRVLEGEQDAVDFVMQRMWPSHWKAYDRLNPEQVISTADNYRHSEKIRALSERQLQGIMKGKISKEDLLSMSLEEILLHGKHLNRMSDKEFEESLTIEQQ